MYHDPVSTIGPLCPFTLGAKRRMALGTWKFTTKAIFLVSLHYMHQQLNDFTNM